MTDFHLRRRIPPNTEEELLQHLLDNCDLKVWEAQAIAKEQHAANMEGIYRLARIGETFERLRECPGGEIDYWRGYADGWNGAQKWVRDNGDD